MTISIFDRPLRVASAFTLVNDHAMREAAGVLGVGVLAPDGRYERRPAALVNRQELALSFGFYANDLRKQTQDYGPTLALELADALILGQGSVITRDGILIKESCRAFLEQNRLPPGLRAQGQELFITNVPAVSREQRPSLLLKAPWWRNYGHWLLDSAALLALVVERLEQRRIQVVVGRQTDPCMRERVRETVAIVAPDFSILEHGDEDAMAFANLCYVTPVSISPLTKVPHALAALRRKVRGDGAAPTGNQKLFVSRGPNSSRPLLNEEEILDVCASRGFAAIRPEGLSLYEQARVFAGAEVVVGVKGAALTNMVFANPGSTVVVLAPNNWPEPFFWDLAGQLDVNYVEILGKVIEGVAQPPNSPFVVDAGLLAATLDGSGSKSITSRKVKQASPGQVVELAETNRTECHAPLPEHAGLDYQRCLRLVHETLKPKSYLEIGVLGGQTISISECATIGIDPNFQPQISVGSHSTALFLFQMTSDDFFSRYSPTAFFERPIDLAFLDGMHRVENLLQDFINVEKCCSADSIVVLHDCLPLDHHMAVRDENDRAARSASCRPAWWTGDVWKVMPILAHFRPDLSIWAFNAPPTGLVLIANLDPANQELRMHFDDIVSRFRTLPDETARFYKTVPTFNVLDTARLPAVIAQRKVLPVGGPRS